MGNEYRGSVGFSGGNMRASQEGPSPEMFRSAGNQRSGLDPSGMIDFLRGLRREEESRPMLAAAPPRTIDPQTAARNANAFTPRQFARPSMSPQGVMGYTINPLDVPMHLQGVVPTGFFTDNTASNFTYSPTVRPGANVPTTGGGGGGGPRFSVTTPEARAEAQARAFQAEQQAQHAANLRMYPTLTRRMMNPDAYYPGEAGAATTTQPVATTDEGR